MTTIQCNEAKGKAMGPDKGKFLFLKSNLTKRPLDQLVK